MLEKLSRLLRLNGFPLALRQLKSDDVNLVSNELLDVVPPLQLKKGPAANLFFSHDLFVSLQ